MTAQQVKKILRQIGLRPQQAAGQNFLWDESVAERMVKAAGIEAGERVLEIGPGLGILTEALLGCGAEVVAVELDRRLAAWLRRRFAAHPGFRLIENDIFKVRLPDIVLDDEYKLVANLPYGATSLVFRNFLTLPPRPSSLTVMIQKEVAERITAKPGAMSLLSVMVQYYARPHYLFDVPRTSFFPAPGVTSAVILVDQLKRPDEGAAKRVLRATRAGFSARRKKLHNALAAVYQLSPAEAAENLRKIGVDPNLRPQNLTVEQWKTIGQKFG